MLRSKFVKLLAPVLKQVNSSPNFASLFSLMKDNFSVLFYSSNNLYFSQKESIQIKNFETFKCSGQNWSNFSCQLWNEKSVPLQVLERRLILFKVWIEGSHQNPNFECSGKNLSYSSCHFRNHKSVESNVRQIYE